MTGIYYNEFDPKTAKMLATLIEEGLVPKGDIDDRSITEVRPSDLAGYTQCHFFAGIGGWATALKLPDWPADRPVWTGSCPCQPFSTAGRQKGKADDRHLWPVWEQLIGQCRPPSVYGEQVESAITKGWLDDVYQGLEAKDYAVGSAVLPACSVGAPHKRNRLWFVGHTLKSRLEGYVWNGDDRLEPRRKYQDEAGSTWATSNWIDCTDGKQRLISTESAVQPLAYGFQRRRWLLHAAGNAIVPQVAAEFIKASMFFSLQEEKTRDSNP